MPDNDFWIGQEQIPVDLSLLLTYSNDEDYWYAPGEYALRVYTVDTLNTNFARPCFALGERTSDPEMEDVSGAIENTLHELLDSGATPEDVYRIMGLVKESELSPETKEADSYLPIDLGYCIDGNIVSYEAVPESVATVPENVDYPRYAEAMESHVPLVICEDGIYAIADWEFNQNAPAIDAMREGNRSRKAKERARKSGGKSASEKKREKLVAFLAAHPSATKTEMSKATGLSRVTINKYLSELPAMLPAPAIPEESGVQKAEGNVQGVQSVQNVQMYTVQNGVQMDVQLYTEMYNNLYTPHTNETAGSTAEQAENGDVQNLSRPKNIDDRYKNTSTSTAVADGDGMTGSGIPTREEVRSHFAEMGFAVDPDRFFDVNEGRGWRTNSGKPVDDWKKLAAVWDRNEHPKAATPPARTEPKANAVGKIPSVEEVMAKWGCDRETAQGYIDENMY